MWQKIWGKMRVKLTACGLVLLLTACVKSGNQASEQMNEAVKARVNLALAYLAENDYPKAKENLDRALSYGSDDYLPYSALAYYYQQIGEHRQAESTYQQAINLSKNDRLLARPDVLNNYGTFLCKQARFATAYQQFELALSSEQPYYHQAETLENLALCAAAEKNRLKFDEAIIKLKNIAPDRAAALSFVDKLSPRK